MSESALKTLLDIERVVDSLDVYAFEHWKMGELVEGPIYEKYFVTCVFMWPHKMMPDPRGGKRLLDYGCEVRYKEDVLQYPVKVEKPDDFESGTKMPKLMKTKVWLVELVFPKKLIKDIKQGSLELGEETVDFNDVDAGFEQGMDDSDGMDDQAAPDAGLEAPAPGGAPGEAPATGGVTL